MRWASILSSLSFSNIHSRYVTDATVAIFVALLLFILPSTRPRCGFSNQNSCDLEEAEEGKGWKPSLFSPLALETFRRLIFSLWTYRRVVSSQETGQEGVCSSRDGIRRLLRPRLLCGAPCCHTEWNDPVPTRGLNKVEDTSKISQKCFRTNMAGWGEKTLF